MIELPELPPDPAGTCEVDCGPDAATGGRVVRYEAGYSADQMRSYGLSCARAAMERAAKIADNMPTADPEGPWFNDDMSSAAYLIAAAIRAEIEKEEAK